jgi:hypothetical protein
MNDQTAIAFGIATVAVVARSARMLFYSSPALYAELLWLFVVWAVLAILLIVQWVAARRVGSTAASIEAGAFSHD